MPGLGLATNRRTVQMAGRPDSKNLWLTFNLEAPLDLKTPLIGPDGKGHPAGFVMFELTPDKARDLADAILEVMANGDRYSQISC